VKCPSSFPISSKKPSKKRVLPTTNGSNAATSTPDQQSQPSSHGRQRSKKGSSSSALLDWHDTVKEVRSYGAKAFEGKLKRDYQDEEYYKLTGRHQKKPRTPLPIVRGLKKAAARREAKVREEAKQAGIILPKSSKETKKNDATYRNYGPAPSIGFMKDGMFRVKTKNKRKKR